MNDTMTVLGRSEVERPKNNKSRVKLTVEESLRKTLVSVDLSAVRVESVNSSGIEQTNSHK